MVAHKRFSGNIKSNMPRRALYVEYLVKGRKSDHIPSYVDQTYSAAAGFISALLKKNNVTMEHAFNYENAYTLAGKNVYSLVILPFQENMPNCENAFLEIQRRFKEGNPYTKLLVLSGDFERVYGNNISSSGNGVDSMKLRFKKLCNKIYSSCGYPLPKVSDINHHSASSLNDIQKLLDVKSSDSIKDQILNIINKDGKLSDSNLDLIFSQIDRMRDKINGGLESLVVSDKGFTSKSGFEFGEFYFKVDIPERLEHETKFYNLDMGEFNSFRPVMKGYAHDETTGVLILENVVHKIETPLIKFRNELKFNLYVMGLFHREARKHFDCFNNLIYYGIHKEPHFEEGNIPFVNDSGQGYNLFEETRIDVRRVKPIVEEYLKKQRLKGDVVVHGDWKNDNVVNGYLVDYAMTGTGFEVDDLAYFLSDCQRRMDLTGFHNCIDLYIKLRSEHDSQFTAKSILGYNKEMHNLASSAFLTQLVLRHSVMNKRDMNDPLKFQQRLYYQNSINKIVKECIF